MYNTHEKKPEIGDEVIFWYDDMWHIGYLINDHGSDKPRKWEWCSYIHDFGVISDLIEWWHELPKEPNA